MTLLRGIVLLALVGATSSLHAAMAEGFGVVAEAPGYERWPYRDVLQQRIAQAAENAVACDQPSSGRPIMVQSTYACMGCHQAR